mgnify:CR=1 FL=1
MILAVGQPGGLAGNNVAMPGNQQNRTHQPLLVQGPLNDRADTV